MHVRVFMHLCVCVCVRACVPACVCSYQSLQPVVDVGLELAIVEHPAREAEQNADRLLQGLQRAGLGVPAAAA